MQAALAHHPAPRRVAAELLKSWCRWLGLHALEDGAMRARRTAARMLASSSDDTLHVEMTSGHERFGTLNRTATPWSPGRRPLCLEFDHEYRHVPDAEQSK